VKHPVYMFFLNTGGTYYGVDTYEPGNSKQYQNYYRSHFSIEISGSSLNTLFTIRIIYHGAVE